MLAFLLRRAAHGVLVLLVVSLAVFLLFFVAAPGDPARLFAGRLATPEQVDLVRTQLGLDQPLWRQYLAFLGRLASWPPDLGYSFQDQEPVLGSLLLRLPATVSLAGGAAVLWLVLGIPLGVLSATRPGSVRDRLATVVSAAGVSMPSFLLGVLLFYLLFFRLTTAGLPVFPPSGYVPLTENLLEWARHLLLPWLSLALVSAATYARLTRGSLLEVLGEDYLRTARAKGLRERTVVYRHGLRGALTPMVTLLGIDFGALLGGAIVTESVFGLNGVGQFALQAVAAGDLPVVMGTVLLAAFFVVVANLLVDLAYAVLDPRVRPT